MPRPLRKRVSPKPETVKITRIDGGPEVEIVRPDELQRRKDEADWQRYRQAAGLDVREEHARLALALGDVFVVPTYTNDLWPRSCINDRVPGWPGLGNVRLSRQNAGCEARVPISGGSPVWCSAKGSLTSYW